MIDVSDLRDHAFDFDVDKIGSRGDRLFPFTDRVLPFSIAANQASVKNVDLLSFAMESRLVNTLPPLTLSPLEMQAVLDASWSRRHRWESFQQMLDMVRRFDPQEGDLPVLLRRYINDSLLQPFDASQNTEPQVWALLSVAADHLEFVQFITNFVARVPSSKTTTELLFLLDKLVQSNLHAVLSLQNLDIANGLDWTKSVSPKGADILVALHKYHERGLGLRGLWDEHALARQYDKVRVRILEQLISTTPHGYRRNDARFLIGEISWQQGRVREALEAWNTITPDASDDYFTVYSEVRDATKEDSSTNDRIHSALSDQRRRWAQASFDRLRHFGYWPDTF